MGISAVYKTTDETTIRREERSTGASETRGYAGGRTGMQQQQEGPDQVMPETGGNSQINAEEKWAPDSSSDQSIGDAGGETWTTTVGTDNADLDSTVATDVLEWSANQYGYDMPPGVSFSNGITALTSSSVGLLYGINYSGDYECIINSLVASGHSPYCHINADFSEQHSLDYIVESFGSIAAVAKNGTVFVVSRDFTPSGNLTTGKIYAGTEMIDKLWTAIDLEVGTYFLNDDRFEEGLLSGKVRVYTLDSSSTGSWTLQGTLGVGHRSDRRITFSTPIISRWIKIKLVISRLQGDQMLYGVPGGSSPVIRRVALQYLPSAVTSVDSSGTRTVKKVFRMNIRVDDHLKMPGGSVERRTANQIRSDLLALVNASTIISFTDKAGTAHNCVITDYSETFPLIQRGKVTQEGFFSIELAEV